MYSMLIVEDERWEREGLVTLLDWSELGIRVAGTAVDGFDGLDKALSMRPDIIVTDIRMPGMGGLEMAGRIRERLPDVRVVVLTGHSDFAYTHEAIVLHADDYLLKPVEEEDIARCMRKVVRQCEQLRSRQLEEQTLRRKLQQGERMAAEKLLADWLHDRIDAARGIDELQAVHPAFRAAGRFETAAFVPPAPVDEEELRARIGGDGFLVGCDALPGALAVVRPAVAGSGATEGANDWAALLPASLAIGVGRQAEGLPGLKTAYRQAVNAARHGLFYGLSGIVTPDAEERERLAFTDRAHAFLASWQEMARQLRLSVMSLQAEETGKLLDRMMQAVAEAPGAGREYVATLLNALLIDLSSLTDSRGDEKGRIGELLGMHRLGDMRAYAARCMTDIVHRLETRRNRKDEYIVEKVLRIVEEQYGASDMSLTRLAEEAFVSPNHLSLLFRRTTGKTVHQYLTDVRMSRAEELLLTTKLKVSEVAARIGMHNISHFCTVFKQEFGMTPGEYQEVMQRK